MYVIRNILFCIVVGLGGSSKDKKLADFLDSSQLCFLCPYLGTRVSDEAGLTFRGFMQLRPRVGKFCWVCCTKALPYLVACICAPLAVLVYVWHW
jgi:hypothetical protein